jgi:IS5 family transposase
MSGNQLGFSDYELIAIAKIQSKRGKFHTEMEVVVPWKALINLVEPHYPKTRKSSVLGVIPWGSQPRLRRG